MRKKPAVNNRWLLILSGLMWTGVGVLLNTLAIKWLAVYSAMEIIITTIIGLLSGFLVARFGFNKIVHKNIRRIQNYPDKVCLFAFQEWKSYLLIAVMMSMGIFLRRTALIPKLWIAPVYIAIGLALFLNSFIYYRSFFNNFNERAVNLNRSTILRLLFWLLLIFGGIFLGICTDIWLLGHYVDSLPFHIITFILGMSLLFFVMRASRHTGRILAKYGRTGDLPRMETNQLVTTDVYQCMRHPMHLGLLFFPLSLALMIGSISFIFIYSPLEMLSMILLIKLLEEKEAIRKFGSDYLSYKQQVPMFNLSPQCLKKMMQRVEK